MPTWPELVAEIDALPPDQGAHWLQQQIADWMRRLSIKRGDRNVLFYASAFLQKPQVQPMFSSIAAEDINGIMSVIHGMNWERGLTLVLHTPGGVTTAAETIGEYLLQKFNDIEVIIPTYAMSAGTMISLAANRIVMGRVSQLGPIDAQLPVNGRFVSARAIVQQFERAKSEIVADPRAAAVWAPAMQQMGPALLQEAHLALEYGESMVARWLEKRHFAQHATPKAKAEAVATHFNRAEAHKSHGRRIDRNEARSQDLVVEDLEADQDLQEIVLTLYHLITIMFEKTMAAKMIVNNLGKAWMKNINAAPV